MNTICDAIFALYDNLQEIECEFVLNDDDTAVIQGKATINKDSDTIKIFGDLGNVVFNSNNVDGNIKIINSSDIPMNYKCFLMNFPNENKKKEIKGNINVNIHKVRISPDLMFMMYSNKSTFEGEIIPLCCNDKNGEMARISIT